MLTALSLLLVTTALSVVMLFVLSSLRDSKVEGVREWGQANACAVLALLLFASRGVLPDLLSIEVANALFLGSSALMLAGFRRHLALPVPTRWLGLGMLAAMAGLGFFHYGIDLLPMRSVLVSIFQAGVYLAIGRTIPVTPEPRLRYAFLFTRRAAFVLGSVHACRGLFYALQVGTPLRFLDPGAWNLAFFAIGTLALPALTLGAVMMANARVLRETAYAAEHDHLTGAWSRRAFFTFAEHEHARALRLDSSLSLLVFDADHFKRINDTHGHATGDRVLRDIVTHAQEVIRKIDYCARLGGEEFAVLLPDASHQTAMDVGKRLLAALDRSLQLAESTLPVGYTVSIGVATLAPDETLADLMARADAALYAAKADGRNRVVSAPAPPGGVRASGYSERG
jgi:diguanylate cyclase (GGDEF)-like protein